jgi:peptide-methionine (S)-S-oxide reductase
MLDYDHPRLARLTRFGVLSALMLGVSLVACDSAAARTPLPALSVGNTLAPKPTQDTAVFAGGCFWGIEAVFERLKGVKSAVSGYSGGNRDKPGYEEVSSGTTGHAEAVQVIYDSSKITYAQLLQVFFSVAHDPTQLNRQGPDHGTQYRSAIFFLNENQEKAVRAYIDQLTKEKKFNDSIVTQVTKLVKFYPAEDYHQNYLVRNPRQPYIVIHDMPKLEALKKQFPDLCKED